MPQEVEQLREMLAEIRDVMMANAGQVAALRAAVQALIFTHPDLPRYQAALRHLLDKTEAVLNAQAQDSILERFLAVRGELLAFVAEGIAQDAPPPAPE